MTYANVPWATHDQDWADVQASIQQKQHYVEGQLQRLTAREIEAVQRARLYVQRADADYNRASNALTQHDQAPGARDRAWVDTRKNLAGDVEAYRVVAEQARAGLQTAQHKLSSARQQQYQSMVAIAQREFDRVNREVGAAIQEARRICKEAEGQALARLQAADEERNKVAGLLIV